MPSITPDLRMAIGRGSLAGATLSRAPWFMAGSTRSRPMGVSRRGSGLGSGLAVGLGSSLGSGRKSGRGSGFTSDGRSGFGSGLD